MSVLIVEDEPVFRANLLDRLLLAGMDVVSAPNGPIGMCFAADSTLHFDAVVADLHLGGPIDGSHIAEMVALIGRLVGSGHAYVAEGHVLFSVLHFAY